MFIIQVKSFNGAIYYFSWLTSSLMTDNLQRAAQIPTLKQAFNIVADYELVAYGTYSVLEAEVVKGKVVIKP